MTNGKLDLALFAADEPGVELARLIAGRGERIKLLVLDPSNVRGRNDAILETIDGHAETVLLDDRGADVRAALASVDLAILVWWPRIVPRELLAVPRLGFLNCHPSLLPHNRGKHYNFWAIVEGAPYGVTIHWADERVDGGDIAFQRPIETTWEDTGETLFYKARAVLVDLLAENYDRIARGDIPRIPQESGTGSFHRASEIDAASRIDLDASYRARDLLNLLRARTFPPYPAAWFMDDGDRYEVRVRIERTKPE